MQQFHNSVQRFMPGQLSDIDSYLLKVASKSHSNSNSNWLANNFIFEASDVHFEDLIYAINEYGVVCINNYFEKSLIDSLNVEINNLVALVEHDIACHDIDFNELSEICWQRNLAKMKTLNQLISFEKPIVNIRDDQGFDSGMWDFFNLNNFKSWKQNKAFNELCSAFQHGIVSQLVTAVSSYLFSGVQLYLNRSVEKTRGFHIDNLFGTYKSFIYLTDVTSDDYGPYCYVPCSHKLPYLHRLELRFTENNGARVRDIWSSKYLRQHKFLAEKGSLIISNQSGIHRGLNQRRGAERRVLVSNYSDHSKIGRRY